MENTGKVKRKPTPLKYIKYDGENYNDVLAFIGGTVPCGSPNQHDCFMFGCGLEARWVTPGLYFIKEANGHVEVCCKSRFKKTFIPWDFQDDMATFILRSHRTCNEDECFVGQMTTYEMSHEIATYFKRKKRSEVTEDDHVIRCVICHEPATTLDCHYPYEVEMNRCEKHQHSKIDPCTWSDYGVAVEVCKDHYSMLVLKAHIEKQLDWLMKQDMHLDENVLRDKLVATLKELDHYMKAKWPKEQMGPAKEDEANGK
jgi:hypothetical protein